MKGIWISFLRTYFIVGAVFLSTSNGTYWTLNLATVAATRGEAGVCDVASLSPTQHAQCLLNRDTVYSSTQGIGVAIAQCQRQFSNRRWNCSASGPFENSFRVATSLGTSETAFVQSIISAGMMSVISRHCKDHLLRRCTCDQSPKTPPEDGSFYWGGCGDNFDYGYQFSKGFSDNAFEGQRESLTDYELMSKHNMEVGRLIVKRNVRTQCRCFGLSGSCSIKLCYLSLPNFNDVGRELRNRYDNAKRVERLPGSPFLLLPNSATEPRDTDLVYIQESPSYCVRDDSYGSLGTQGRECQKDSTGTDGCVHMCCGRGYRRESFPVIRQCNCRLLNCISYCTLKCDECAEIETRYYCN